MNRLVAARKIISFSGRDPSNSDLNVFVPTLRRRCVGRTARAVPNDATPPGARPWHGTGRRPTVAGSTRAGHRFPTPVRTDGAQMTGTRTPSGGRPSPGSTGYRRLTYMRLSRCSPVASPDGTTDRLRHL